MAFWDGWFDDEEEIHISTSTVKLAEEGQQIIRDSILNSVVGERDIAGDLITNLRGSLAPKAKHMQNYAKDHYTYGLPNGHGETVLQARDVVAEAIKQDIGERVYIEGSDRTRAAPAFFIEEYLREHRGWDENIKLVTIPPAGHPFTRDITVVRRQFTPSGDLLITYREKGTQGEDVSVLPLFTETVPFSGVDSDKDYYHVTYQKYAGAVLLPEVYFWHYEVGSGVYPTLDNVHYYTEPVPYLPIIPLRHNKQNMVADSRKDTPLYKSSRRCLQIMDMDFKKIGDEIHKNPNIGDVNSASLLFAVNPADDQQAVKQYMHEWIKHLDHTYPSSKTDVVYQNGSISPLRQFKMSNRVRINYADAGLQNYFEYGYTSVVVELGVISNRIGYTELKHLGNTTNLLFSNDVVECKQQISPTEIEITKISGLTHWTHVVDGEWSGIHVHEAFGGNEGFTIPINMNALARLPLPAANDVISHSARITFTSYEITSLPWYKTGMISWLVLIIVVAVTIVTGQWYATAAYIATLSAVELVLLLAITIAVNIAVKEGLKVLSRYLSPELALIIAAIVYSVLFFFNPEPSGMLQSASVAAAASAPSDLVAMVNDRELQELLAESQEFGLEVEAMNEELKEIEEELDFLGDNFDLTRTLLERRQSIPRIEDFEKLRRRTIELPENNVLVLRGIEEFVNIKLKLPDFEETVNSFNQDGITLTV